MGIETKVEFMRDVEMSLMEKVTVSDMTHIMKTIMDVLEGYEINAHIRATDENDDLLMCFVSALKVEGRSQKTIDRYVYIIRRMMERVNVSTRMVTVYHLRSYLAEEKERGISDQTLEGYRAIFSSYFNWLQRESLIDKNPTVNLGSIKVAKKEKKTYSEIDMERLNHNCRSIRDRAIINFLSSTGCRVSEMTELNRDDIDLHNLECVVHGKGNKERSVYLGPVAGMLIDQYLRQRKDDNPALFVNIRGQRLLPGGVRAMLTQLAKKAGVAHVHPHKFRRT